MLNKKRLIATAVFFVVMTLLPVFGLRFVADIDTSFSASIVIPDKLFQTGTCTDISPLGVFVDKLHFLIGISYYNAFEGFVRYPVYLSSFYSVGPDVKLSYGISERIDIYLKGRMMFATMNPSTIRFMYFDIEGGVGYAFVKTPSFNLFINMPICVGLRKDVTEIRAGIGLSARIL